LHRPFVDDISISCPACEHGTAYRIEPVLDAWFDSGSMPAAQFHYPFELGPFDPAAPLDYIAEGLDQTRGWFYSLLVIATLLFDRPAYRSCLVNGMVLDEGGRKMSKSKGNAVEPMTLLARFGGDPVRWTFLSSDFTEPLRIGETTVLKTSARTLGTLGHVVTFHLENARPDRLPPVAERPAPVGLLDRWILSRLEGTRAAVTAALSAPDPRPAAAAVRGFVDDLSTWYLRRSRPRFWGETGPADRAQAHATLSYTLLGLARTVAPLVPFLAEWIFQEVGERGFADGAASVHCTEWPTELAPRDLPLEAAMEALRGQVEAGRELRQRAGVRARIPLPSLVLFEAPEATVPLGDAGTALLADELNVRRVTRVPRADRGRYPESEWVVREEGGVPTMALARTPTPELLQEGLAREVGRRLQQVRKELGLRYEEPVAVEIGAVGPLREALERHRETLARELLATPLQITEGPLPDGPRGAPRSWDLDGETFTARLTRRPG